MNFTASCGAWALFFMKVVHSIPVSTVNIPVASFPRARELDGWQSTLSNDTHDRLNVALQHLDDESAPGQAFRNDTIMR